jgi:hypothetical protein
LKLTVKAALEMLQAIGQLDSYHNGSDKPTLYKYSGDIRLKIAMVRRKLRAIQEDYADTRNQLIVDMSKGTGGIPIGPQSIEFAKRDREMLDAEVDVDIQSIPVEALNLDENPIPPSVLDLLGDFVEATQ